MLDDSGVCEDVDLGASPTLGPANQGPSQCQNAPIMVSSSCTVHVYTYMYVYMYMYYQKATEFQETSLKASHQCYVCMTCNMPTPGHPSVPDEAWYCQKCVQCTG